MVGQRYWHLSEPLRGSSRYLPALILAYDRSRLSCCWVHGFQHLANFVIPSDELLNWLCILCMSELNPDIISWLPAGGRVSAQQCKRL